MPDYLLPLHSTPGRPHPVPSSDDWRNCAHCRRVVLGRTFHCHGCGRTVCGPCRALYDHSGSEGHGRPRAA